MATLPDRQQLDAEIAPRLWDLQGLHVAVYAFRLADRQQLSCAVAPRAVSHQALEVTVLSTALRAAGESAVLAPVAEITFL